MQLLYNSDSFVVVRFDMPGAAEDASQRCGGYEIVDKFARKEIFLQGAVADSFHRGVQALVQDGPNPELIDEYIADFTTLAQQPVVLH
jgi:hypothetical protein